MDLKSFIQSSFKESFDTFRQLSENSTVQLQVQKAAELMINSYKAKGTLFVAGNGGSAADAQHIAAEMVGKLAQDRTPLPAFAMTVDSSLLTAVGNDYGYNEIFSRQVEGLMKPQDLFLGISTSGNSTNLVQAFEMCRTKGIKSVLLSGKEGGEIAKKELADVVILAPGPNTARIQECHIAIYHCLCFMVEHSLIESGHIHYRNKK